MIELLLNNLPLLLEADGDGKRVRDAILQLAVRGRLVAQKAEEGEWASKPLAEVVRSKSGNSKIIKGKQSTVPKPGLVQGFSASGPNIWVKEPEHSGEGIVVSAVGARCGKAFRASGQWTAIANTHAILPSDSVDADWLFLLLNNEDFWVKSGSAQPFVKVKATLQREQHLPPLAEQHRIVAKVDELMEHAAVVEERHLAATSARVRLRDAALHALAEAEDHEAVETGWSRIEEHFDDLFTEPEDIQPLRQTILQLAVRGRLVAQEEGDEDAQTLLKQIEAEKQRLFEAGEIKKPKSLPALKAETVTGGTPQGWCWCRFGRVQEFIGGFAFKSGEYQDSGVGIVRMSNLKNGVVDVRDMKRVPLGYLDSLGQELQVRPGDLLIGMSGSIGQPAFNITSETFLLNQRVGKIVPIGISVRYVYFFLRVIEEEFIRVSFGSGIKNLSTRQILETAFPLPPLAEQHRIVAKVDELIALCDTLETSLTRAKATREQFAGSISHTLAESH